MIEKIEFTNSPPRIEDIPEFEMKMFAYNLMRATKKWKFARLDKENRLPHKGYLYLFLHTQNGPYDLVADVRYFDGEIELAINDFNAEVLNYEKFSDAYLMEFYQVDDDADCTRLLGEPSDWNYNENPPKLLMQFDPLDSDMGFLDFLDGFIYFFFGRDESKLEEVYLKEEYS